MIILTDMSFIEKKLSPITEDEENALRIALGELRTESIRTYQDRGNWNRVVMTERVYGLDGERYFHITFTFSMESAHDMDVKGHTIKELTMNEFLDKFNELNNDERRKVNVKGI